MLPTDGAGLGERVRLAGRIDMASSVNEENDVLTVLHVSNPSTVEPFSSNPSSDLV